MNIESIMISKTQSPQASRSCVFYRFPWCVLPFAFCLQQSSQSKKCSCSPWCILWWFDIIPKHQTCIHRFPCGSSRCKSACGTLQNVQLPLGARTADTGCTQAISSEDLEEECPWYSLGCARKKTSSFQRENSTLNIFLSSYTQSCKW